MSSGDHRYAQPPSRVLHIRNLPYETTHEELEELASPFGTVQQSKLAVGPNRNQAFIEFESQSIAIAMVQYFASASEPAKVRGKTVYLQYSTRNEIINSTVRNGEGSGNILLISLDNMDPTVNVTIDTLHLVFSAFGTVHKIATFEKSSGFQALVQYPDNASADQVRQQLDGRHIPKHLVDNHPNPPMMKIAFSQHTDLNIKFQSHRSRDYMNPYLPVAPFAESGLPGSGGVQAPIHSDPTAGNILLVQIENQAYPVTVEPLHTVFSPYGNVQKIAVFEKNSSWQALVQYADNASAANAMAALEGHAIYDGGYNRIKLSYSVHRNLNVRVNNERGWDYTGANTPADVGDGAPGGAPPVASAGGINGLAVGLEDAPSGAEYEAAHEHIAAQAQQMMQARRAAPAGPPPGPPHMMGRGGPPPGGYQSPRGPAGYGAPMRPGYAPPGQGGPPMRPPSGYGGPPGRPPYPGAGGPPRGPPPPRAPYGGPPTSGPQGGWGGGPPRGPPMGGYPPRGPPQRY